MHIHKMTLIRKAKFQISFSITAVWMDIPDGRARRDAQKLR